MSKRFIVKTAGFSTWVQDTLKGRKVEGTGSTPEDHARAADRLNKDYEARTLKLTAEESRILRRELPAVRGLIDKGLITGYGVLTAAGQKWIDEEYPALLKAARTKGGEVGGQARADTLTRKERVKIAVKAGKASIKVRKAAAREKEK